MKNSAPNHRLILVGCHAPWLLALLLLLWPAVVHSQFIYATNNGTITITGYTGSGTTVSIPSLITGLPVTSIASYAFASNGATNLTNLTISTNVTAIGDWAFFGCIHLAQITVESPNPVYSSMDGVLFFDNQTVLIKYPPNKSGSLYTIPNGVTSIGYEAFIHCSGLTRLMIPSSVTILSGAVFAYCTNLTGAYFLGNAPIISSGSAGAFVGDNNVIVYYSPGSTGWGASFGYAPTWNPQVGRSSASFDGNSDRFGFPISGNSNLVVRVQACTNLIKPLWQTIESITLTNGTSYFSDFTWTNSRARYYRLSSP